jgi:hypothetical protein
MDRMNKFALLGAVISAFYYPRKRTTGLIDDFIKKFTKSITTTLTLSHSPEIVQSLLVCS